MSNDNKNKKPIYYSSTGVNYNAIDPIKRSSQIKAKETSSNLAKFGTPEVSESRGESAFVWEEGDCYKAFVIEGLGTKNLVADEVRKFTGKTHYDSIAQDTVAMIVNDLIVVGTQPMVINAYFASGSSEWFEDKQRSKDLIEGWAKTCNMAGATWGGGETPVLKGIINPENIDLAGSCVGIIKPKERLTLGDKLKKGDIILLIESSGIHANGLSLARTIAEKLPEGYSTKLSDGSTFGETLLQPTYLYVQLVKDLQNAGIEIHYMVNITGHGWKKLMRANQEFSYVINEVPSPQPIFNFIQEHSGNSDEQMYATFNMGAGFAIFLPADQVEKAQEIALKNNLKSWNAGVVEEGKKQIFIKPKNITLVSLWSMGFGN